MRPGPQPDLDGQLALLRRLLAEPPAEPQAVLICWWRHLSDPALDSLGGGIVTISVQALELLAVQDDGIAVSLPRTRTVMPAADLLAIVIKPTRDVRAADLVALRDGLGET